MDNFLWVVATLCQAAIGGLGFYLSLRPNFAEQRFTILATTFVLLTIISVATSFWGFHRSAKSNAAVALLTEQILYEVKGSPDGVLEIGPTFTKSQGGDYEKGICTFLFHNESKYPLVQTRVGIVGTRYLNLPEYGVSLGDIPAERGGTLPGLSVTLPKDKPSRIDFSIDSRSLTLWQSIYFIWNGKGWISDSTIFKEVDAKQVYIKDLRPNSPFSAEVEKRKRWAREKEAAEEVAAKEN